MNLRVVRLSRAAIALVVLLPVLALAGPGWLGVGVGEVSAERMSALKLKEERGVEIVTVAPNSPAAEAGLKEHDVVLDFNGQPVVGVEQFQRMVRETPAGRSARLLISRDGATQTITVKLAERAGARVMMRAPEGRHYAFTMPPIPEIPPIEIPELEGDFMVFAGRTPRLGVDAEGLTKQLGEFFGVPSGEGVLVKSVEANSAADKAGIKAGDIITKVDGEKVENLRDLRNTLRDKASKGTVPLTVVRNKKEMSLSVTLERPEQPRVVRPGERV